MVVTWNSMKRYFSAPDTNIVYVQGNNPWITYERKRILCWNYYYNVRHPTTRGHMTFLCKYFLIVIKHINASTMYTPCPTMFYFRVCFTLTSVMTYHGKRCIIDEVVISGDDREAGGGVGDRVWHGWTGLSTRLGSEKRMQDPGSI